MLRGASVALPAWHMCWAKCSGLLLFVCQTLGDLQLKKPGFRFKSWWGPELGCKYRCLFEVWVLSVCSDECLPLGALVGKRLCFVVFVVPRHSWSQATNFIPPNRRVKKCAKSTQLTSAAVSTPKLTLCVLMPSSILRSLAHLCGADSLYSCTPRHYPEGLYEYFQLDLPIASHFKETL